MNDFNPKECELTDITDEFLSACKDLNESELAKNDDFKLSEAMSAIEIMDPKMDTGIVKIERKLDTFSPEELSNASLEEIIAIFDATIAMLTSWINAQPMDQTLFTNLCLLKPTSLETQSPHLYSMALSILYIINLFRAYINIASVSNEEDICLVFPNDFMTNEFTLDQVENQLENSITAINNELKKKPKSAEFAKLLEALKYRIEFFMAFFELLNHLLPPYATLIQQPIETANRFVPDFKKSTAAVFKSIQLLQKARETIQLGSQPPQSGNDADFSWLPVFDPNAYLYLSPPGFPRRPKLHTRLEAYVYLGELLETISLMIRGVLDSVGSTEEICEILRQFGDEKSSALTRSILQLIIMPNDHIICGTFPISDIILASMNRTSGLLEGCGIEEIIKVLLAGDPTQQKYLDDFLENLLTRGFVGIFQTLGNNLARQREKMLKINFDDFGILHVEATRIEAEFEMLRFRMADEHNAMPSMIPSIQHIFSNYILHTILELLHSHFSLGFHLRLFQPYEFTYVYWYFGDIVARSLSNFCDRIFNTMRMEYGKSPIHQQKKVSGKKLQQKTKFDNEFRKNLSRIKMRSFLYRVEMIMAHAMFKFMTGLIAAKQLDIPPREHLRYAKRVEPFQNVPNMLFYTYEEYLRESRIGELIEQKAHEEMFKEAGTYFGQVITVIKETELEVPEESEYSATLEAIQKLAKKNMIVANLMATQKMNDKKLSFEFSSQQKQLNFPLIGFI